MNHEKERVETRELKVRLTRDELLGKGEELARTIVEIIELEDSKRTAQVAADSLLKRLKGNANRLSRVINDQYELRQVEVTERFNYSAGIAEMVRLDTYEIVATRPLTAFEMQGQLFEKEREEPE